MSFFYSAFSFASEEAFDLDFSIREIECVLPQGEPLLSAARRRTLEEKGLVKVTSNAMPGEARLSTITDESGNLVGFAYYPSTGARTEIRLDQLARGVVLYRASGKDVIRLQGERVSSYAGGEIRLVYLINGITNKQGTFYMELVKSPNGWFVQTNGQSGRKVFSGLFLEKNEFLGKLIGIKDIRPY